METQLDKHKELQELESSRMVLAVIEIVIVILFLVVFVVIFFTIEGDRYLLCIVAWVTSLGVHRFVIGQRMEKLRLRFDTIVREEFFRDFDPNLQCSFRSKSQDGISMLKRALLVEANYYEEKNVLSGTLGNITFHFSEVVAYNNSLAHEDAEIPFEGVLFRIKVAGEKFPTKRIYTFHDLPINNSNPARLDHTTGLYIESENNLLADAFTYRILPYANYIKKRKGELRVFSDNDEIVFLLKLHDVLSRGFGKGKYFYFANSESFLDNRSKEREKNKLAFLMLMVDDFQNDLDVSKVEKRLSNFEMYLN